MKVGLKVALSSQPSKFSQMIGTVWLYQNDQSALSISNLGVPLRLYIPNAWCRISYL